MNTSRFIAGRDMLRHNAGCFGTLALGGASHLDTFDSKPTLQANDGNDFKDGRGGKLLGSPWKFAQQEQSGQWMSSLFPHVAKHADDLCLLSAMHTGAPAREMAGPIFHPGNQLQARPNIGS